jgi:mono/diheme cytochrome c family protein
MSDLDNKELKAIKRELPEPEEGQNPWPYAVWLFFGIMIGWGATYLAFQAGSGEVTGGDRRTIANPSAISEEEIKVDGSAVYKNVCVACHQQTGLGIPGAFPPLAGSEWVTGDPKIPVRILLKGLQGAIEVKGVAYNGVMPAFESQLKDEEITAVVNYIRKEWGNTATDEMTKSDVTKLREELKDRSQAWSATELKELK